MPHSHNAVTLYPTDAPRSCSCPVPAEPAVRAETIAAAAMEAAASSSTSAPAQQQQQQQQAGPERQTVPPTLVMSRRRAVGLLAAALLTGPLLSSYVDTASASPQPPVSVASDGGLPPKPELGAAEGAEEVFCYVVPEPLDERKVVEGALLPGSSAAAGGYYSSLAAAVAACPEGAVVLVAAGRYRERLVLSRPITVRTWPKGARVEVVWETSEPYQSTVEVSAPTAGPASGDGGPGRGGRSSGGQRGAEGVVLEGLTIRHSSKSVANNFGVFIRGGSPRLLDCDISSATGAGVGVEGASPQASTAIMDCRIHDCARQGIAIFGGLPVEFDLDPAIDPGLLYGMTGGTVQGCDVYGNSLDGVLVRSGASPDLLDNLIHNNGGFGVNLQDCAGRYERNMVYDNARGSLAVSSLFELDPGDLAGSNSLRGLMRRL
ncbi:hypothetical protein VOLCADRAFT_103273 [Volvox carteri f. nagariensis]|uniref:Right handed beta helix domain-containing protein n=1 Tax=Volvox carteri f. nagariensis TaxID=3068 RepID=D8TKX3_VOLCA|nr:uncharacterized protein VOLCADRAFT_103273 [Volvox carteri f. nagariensis]EFJ51771.1 hypothetical protein VOLCADRAFT_103273 [Volvox carteri f. nagariensis]|eukprot:XP_002947181.1 hypothetical protein VOLCADRAFT_103273 [Volvox carteri f. nagariensis]